MSFIDALTALLILGIFFFGFSQIFLPVYNAWNKATGEYNTAKAIHFIAESFKGECAKPDRNMENWKRVVSAVRELESCEIRELRKNGSLKALKAVCVISGKYLEIIGWCAP